MIMLCSGQQQWIFSSSQDSGTAGDREISFVVLCRCWCILQHRRESAVMVCVLWGSRLLKWKKERKKDTTTFLCLLFFSPKNYYILTMAGVPSMACCQTVSLEQWSCEARRFANDQNVNVIVEDPPSSPHPPQSTSTIKSTVVQPGKWPAVLG